MFWILQLSQTEETQRKNRFDREQQTKRMRVASQVGSAVGGTAAAMRNILKGVQQDAQADTEQTGENEKADAPTSGNSTAGDSKGATPTTSDSGGDNKKAGPTTSSLGDVLDKNQAPTRDTAAVPNTNEVGQGATKNDQDQENKEWENKEWDARLADAKQKADEEEEWENKEWDARLADAKAGGAKNAAAKIPGAGAVMEGLGKLFPILELLIGPKFKPDTSILTKILCYAGTWITIILVWPLLAFVSFLKFRNFVFFKLPETTTIELVASIIPIFTVLFIILIFSYFFICDPSLKGTIQRGVMNLITNVNINCGF